MAVLDNYTPFTLEKFFSGFFLTSNPTLPPPTSALYPSQDFLLDQGMIRKRPGDREFQTSPQVLSGRIQKAFDWLDNSGTRHLFILSTTNLYHYNTGTGVFDSFLSGLVGSPDIIPQAASFFGKLLFFNGGNKVFKSDGTLGGSSIIATAPVAKTGTVFGGRVIVGNVTSGASTTGPTAVVWSNSLDETNWTTGSSGANQLDRDDDQIQRMVIYRSQLMIARRKSMNVSSVLVTSPYYSFESLVEGLGTPFPDSVQVFPLGVIFAGDENLYLLTGTVPTPIGFGVREFLLGANLSFAGRTVGAVNLSEGRYYLGIPFGADQDPVDVLAYNYQEGHVEYWKKPNLTGLGASYFSQGVTWASMTNPWCVGPESKVLMADLTWRTARDVCVGDAVVGFDEQPRGSSWCRRLRTSYVIAVGLVRDKAYQIRHARGSVVSGARHKWLASNSTTVRWLRAEDLLKGRRRSRVRVMPTWESEGSWEEGFLSAAFDGEGCVSKKSSTRRAGGSVLFSQKPGPFLERVHEVLRRWGIKFVEHRRKHDGVAQLRIEYVDDIMRLVGKSRPVRLLERVKEAWQHRKYGGEWLPVLAVEPLGECSLIGVQTTTGTLIVDGLYSHNSTYTMTWDELGALASQQQTLYLKADGTVYSETDLQRKDRYNGADVLYGMTFKTPLFALGPQGQGQQTDPSPSLVEFVQLDCQPNMANLTVQLGWSRGAGIPPTVSTARTVSVPTSGVMAGAILLGFDTREAPYWQLTIQDAVANEDPRIFRAVLWSRKRGRTVR